MSFVNKVVLVTGGSSGIGAAIAIEFSKEGANVAIVGRNQEKLNHTSAECEKVGEKPLIINADVARDEDVKRLVQETVDKFGKINILVNNAGITRFGSLLEGKILSAYDEIISVNLRAVINITSLATPHLIETKGNVINISSVFATLVPSQASHTPYWVSKTALNHFTRCAALELSSKGVRVNAISPGPVKTDILGNAGATNPKVFWEESKKITALNRVGDPEEIADLALFLASDKARSITGSNYVSDNGMLLKN